MCATCGCAGSGAVVHAQHGSAHEHEHGHGHPHAHVIPPGDARTVELQQKVLAKNDGIAARNRDWLAARGVRMLNLMSSPGAGKTTLLERTARAMAGAMDIAVIEGDQETALDASRISAAGCRVVQINTGSGCHLDAAMVERADRRTRPGGRYRRHHRERGQPGVPRPVRPRRGAPGGARVGDRGPRQAAEVPADVQAGRPRPAYQGGPAPVRRVRHRALRRRPGSREPVGRPACTCPWSAARAWPPGSTG